MARNRINLWSYGQPERGALKKRGIRFLTGGHMIQNRFLHPDIEYPYNHNNFIGDEHKPKDPYRTSSDFLGDINGDKVLSYKEAHPRWYGQIDGKRRFDIKTKHGVNFCTTNQDAVTELANNFIKDLISGKWSEADMINFWPIDVGKWCECERCKAVGTPTDRLLLLIHQIRQHINKAMAGGQLKRNIMLAAPAYLETRKPPSKPFPSNFDYKNNIITFFPIERCYSHTFNDYRCTDINHYHLKDMEKWVIDENRYYRGKMFLGEYYNISLLASLPVMFTRVMANDLLFYYERGIRHLHYMHAETKNWGTMLLTNYQFAKTLWNPYLDVNVLFDELYKKYYGDKAASLMQKFYFHLEQGMSSMKTIRWAGKTISDSYSLDKRLRDDNSVLFSSAHLQYETYHGVVNDGRDVVEMVQDIKKCRSLINRALSMKLNPKHRHRIQEVENRFAYGEAMVHFYDNLIQTHQAHHANNKDVAKDKFHQTLVYAQKLKDMTDVIQVVGGLLRGSDGFSASFNKETFERYQKLYGDN